MNPPRVVAIIQARVGSSRLPGKVLLPLGGKSVLSNVVARVTAASNVNALCIATTTSPKDDAVEAEAVRPGAAVFRGSEADVLSRYLGAARECAADVIVRVTSDCPLLDPWVLDDVVSQYLRDGCDYASNTVERSFPRGLDVEVVSRQALEVAGREATRPDEREHVTLFFHHNASRFRMCSVTYVGGGENGLSRQRWTLDTPADFHFLEQVFNQYGIAEGVIPPFADVARFVQQHPEIAMINADVQQKPAGDTHA